VLQPCTRNPQPRCDSGQRLADVLDPAGAEVDRPEPVCGEVDREAMALEDEGGRAARVGRGEADGQVTALKRDRERPAITCC
jgi:hypothetical protein